MSWFAHLMGLSAVLLAVALSLPQVARLARTRQVSGVSLAAVTNSTISFAAWSAYSFSVHDAWLLASSVVGLPGQALATWLAWRCGADRRQMWLPLAWLLVLAAVTALDVRAGTSVLPVVIGGSVLWYVTPALVAAWRAADVSGIAAGSWWVLVAEGAIFLAYGLLTQEPAMTLYGAACLAGAGGVLARVARGPRVAGTSRPTERPTLVPPCELVRS